MSFRSNPGRRCCPNYFYNNNYTIVQTKDHVMILTEMVNDARIDEQLFEYACHAGNYALSNILSGERAKEKQATPNKQ